VTEKLKLHSIEQGVKCKMLRSPKGNRLGCARTYFTSELEITFVRDNWFCHWTSEIATICCLWDNVTAYSQTTRQLLRQPLYDQFPE